ncbi:acyltransferase family 3-like protein [Dermatophagoides farinae]|uniref:Acyltransferase family 3-like protein n=1 Tax=Dermatophagoides farinae TaxID=6954 RepID=A0A9D4SG85_DERFA|nr:uncharacterized protein LOC124490200 [Dermatophagoides farinae]KAH7639865.1 acyltransferase family 3-like protein [Dermatophagoides farinae]
MAIVDHLVKIVGKIINLEVDQQQMMILADIVINTNISNECLWSLAKISSGVFDRQIWALKFLDAFGKFPTGIAEGSFSHFGEYDECLEIEHHHHHNNDDDHSNTIYGRYCLAKIIIPYPPTFNPMYQPSIDTLYVRHHFEYFINFLRLYNLDNYLTMRKVVEKLNNQHGTWLRLGVCFPTACQSNEFELLLNEIFYPVFKLPIELEPDCYDRQTYARKSYDNYEFYALIILSTIIIVNLICTACHFGCIAFCCQPMTESNDSTPIQKLFFRLSKSQLFKWIICFSIIANTEALFDFHCYDDPMIKQQMMTTNNDDDDDDDKKSTKQKNHHHHHHKTIDRFKCIDVVRLFLVINVCVDHMFLFPPFMAFMSFKRILNSVITKAYDYNRYFFARNILIIDTMFLISGLLLSYSLLRKLAINRGRFNYIVFTIRLWLKYSIPMFFIVQLFWLLPLSGDGPLWNMGMKMLVNTCKESDSLLSSFTYLSNYRIRSNQNVFNFDQKFALCNPPTWFLSALFQLQIIGPLFILAIYHYQRFGLGLNIFMVLFGCYTSILPDHLFGQLTYMDGPSFSSLEELTHSFVAYHMGINQYLISFFLGIIIGFLIIQRQIQMNPNQSINNDDRKKIIVEKLWLKRILWIMAIAGLIISIYWFMTLHTMNVAPSRTSILLWFSIGKLIGCLSIAWMLYELCIGQAIIIEKIFSIRLFQFLSRLTFGIYLLHFLPLAHRLFTVRDSYVMTDKLLFEFILIDFIQTSIMAAIFYVIIERPFNNFTTMIVLNIATMTNKSHCNDNIIDRIIDNHNECIDSADIKDDDDGDGNKRKFSQYHQNGHDEMTNDSHQKQQYQYQYQSQHASSSSMDQNNNNNSLSLSHQVIKIEIQDLKLSLPQVNLFTANCGDRT